MGKEKGECGKGSRGLAARLDLSRPITSLSTFPGLPIPSGEAFEGSVIIQHRIHLWLTSNRND